MRKPSNKEQRVLQAMLKDEIDPPYKHARTSKDFWDAMEAEGWVEWVSSPQTYEEGYRITEAGDKAAYE